MYSLLQSMRFTSTLFILFTTTTIFTFVSASDAFSVRTTSNTPTHTVSRCIGIPVTTTMVDSGLRLRGGTTVSAGLAATVVPQSDVTKTSAAKKIRIQAFDSLRFFLIIQIVLGHFISFANPPKVVLNFFSQHNVLVGAFFALSGYVTAYTSTENGERIVSPKVAAMPKQKWILSKIFGYYPLHFVTLLLFAPIFLYADVFYNGWYTALIHGAMSFTLTQAWAPSHAEIWNAPTWFLSALSFATATIPYCLPAIAALNVTDLIKTGYWIFIAYMLPKLGYTYDTNTWTMAEGITPPKLHPNLAVFNVQRFSPLFAVAEVLLGIIACRIVMLDGTEGKAGRKTNALSTIGPLIAMVGLMVARAVGLLNLSDMLFRGGLFIPLFLRFLMAAHRNTVKGESDILLTMLKSDALVTLGNLAFPIYIVHGPLGQIFFKKIVAIKLWGKVLAGPGNFVLYLAATLGTAWILQKTVLQNKSVNNFSTKAVDSLSSWI